MHVLFWACVHYVVGNALGVEYLVDKGLPESRARGPLFHEHPAQRALRDRTPSSSFCFFSLFVGGTWWVRKFQKAKSSFTIGGTFHFMKCSSYE
jgi:hypothetical protein